ncbi:MAG TPA: hypothetical protein GX719_10555 [Gammaproteobacteria bacterium]|nr:hypothetical protein [Gammaproteobacteria bacterium]
MQYTHFMDKYPTHHVDILKSATTCTSVDDMLAFFRNKVETDPRACMIGEFDHYAHTKSLEGGEVAENIHAAKHLVFCFGIKLPNPIAMAARPRSIGVCEMDDCFTVSFLEAPNPMMHQVMLDWVAELQESKKA